MAAAKLASDKLLSSERTINTVACCYSRNCLYRNIHEHAIVFCIKDECFSQKNGFKVRLKVLPMNGCSHRRFQ